MRVLMTGAGGFIGSNLVRALLSAGQLTARQGISRQIDRLLLVDSHLPTFADSRLGSRGDFDAVIYATGYKTAFPFLAASLFSVTDGGMVDLYRRMTPPGQPGLFFAGLVQPIGATIPLVEVQARWIAAVLADRMTLPSAAEMAREVKSHHEQKQRTWLNSARYTLEVDSKSYAGALRKDMERNQTGL